MPRPVCLIFALALAGCIQTAPLALDPANGRRTVNERANGRSADVKTLGAPPATSTSLPM